MRVMVVVMLIAATKSAAAATAAAAECATDRNVRSSTQKIGSHGAVSNADDNDSPFPCPVNVRPPRAPRWMQIHPSEAAVFTRGGTISLVLDELFVDESFRGKQSHFRFSTAQVAVHGHNAARSEPALAQALASLRESIAGAKVGIVGSQLPVTEGMLLSLGADHVTVVEHNLLTIDNDRVSTIQGSAFPLDLRLDLVVAMDSLQHSGLGRYGDPICGDADLIAMRELARNTDMLVLGVPTGDKDKLVWNGHRVYGPIRLPLLLRGWTVRLKIASPSPILSRTVFVLTRDEQMNTD